MRMLSFVVLRLSEISRFTRLPTASWHDEAITAFASLKCRRHASIMRYRAYSAPLACCDGVRVSWPLSLLWRRIYSTARTDAMLITIFIRRKLQMRARHFAERFPNNIILRGYFTSMLK